MDSAQVIHKYAGKRFEYGRSDCCLFVGEMIEAATGVNPMIGFAYKNKSQATALIKQHGDIEAAITSALGKQIDVDKAVDGDVVTIDTRLGATAAIIYDGRIVARTPTGLMNYPKSWASKAWRAPCRR